VYIGAGLTTAVCLSLMAVIVSTDGMPARYPHLSAAPAPPSLAPERTSCSVDSKRSDQRWDASKCQLTRGPGPRVLLWGDSLAGHYRAGLLQAGADIKAEVFQYTTTVCPPVFGYETVARPHCPQFNDRVIELISTQEISTVILAARWEYVRRRHGELDRLRATVERLRKAGVDVVVVGQTPIFPVAVESLFARHGPSADGSAGAFTAVHQAINDALRSVLPEFVRFVDPASSFCRGESCRYLEGGQFLFSDGAHFSQAGSEYAVRTYLRDAVSGAGHDDNRVD
jgi:hypothetical protein